MNKPRIGVIGIGHLGSIHAKIYQESKNCRLAGVSDIDKERQEKISQQLGVPGFCDHKELFGKVDAVSVATTTCNHYKIARDFLENNIHVLVEKPFTVNLQEADSLIKIAKEKNLILQVGHIERFNSAFSATVRILHHPRFIECHRLSPFPHRSLDVGVVLDLMIHDIDIVLGIVHSNVKQVDAVGIHVLTEFEDIANCRLTFENGCVANLTASRISDDSMRKIRIFQEDMYISLDYKEAKALVYQKSGAAISKEHLPIEKEQPLQRELESFISCVSGGEKPLVSGEVAREALQLAIEIQDKIRTQIKNQP